MSDGPVRFEPMSPVMKALVVTSAAVYVVSMLVGGQFDAMFGLVPSRVLGERWVWQPFTYLFLHYGFINLLFNLMWLWMFGTRVEGQWGPREFLKYFLLTGVGAGLVCVAALPAWQGAITGFSAVIYGLLVAFAMQDPNVHQPYFFLSIKTKYLAVLFGLIQFLVDPNPFPARVALLSGAGIGYFYIRWWWTLSLHAKGLLARFGEPGERPTSAKPRRRAQAVGGPGRPEGGADDEMAEVDRILDKILAHGEASLTEREREVLRRQARKRPPEGGA